MKKEGDLSKKSHKIELCVYGINKVLNYYNPKLL